MKGTGSPDDNAFVKALVANPADEATRNVYADWLEERGDPRGDYLRLELALAKASPESATSQTLRRKLLELRTKIQRSWLAVLDQPGVMLANPTPFPASWWGCELEGYREVEGTYGCFPYESVPRLPINLLRGDFAWLSEDQKPQKPGKKRNRNVKRLVGAAADLGLQLPKEFQLFMGNIELQERIRSCTDCYFNWPDRIAESPGKERAYFVRFYSDSQGCLHWYLYLTDQGYHCVIVTGGFYGGDNEFLNEFDSGDEEEAFDDIIPQEPDDPSNELFFCAPSFEAFLYRIWIENEIWFSLSHDHDPLTPDEQEYVNQYVRK